MDVQVQPFTIKDFSGGITENIVGGDPRRSASLQNWIIQVDGRIKVRPGYRVGLGLTIDGQLPSGQVRVNNLFSVIDETYLFGQSGRNLYWYDPINSWTPVITPAGNPPIQGGDAYNQTTIAEFQHQFYLASDGGHESPTGTQPTRVFRDTTDIWQARTAGLPRVFATPPFNNGTLLGACLNLANALRAAFISHFSDATPGNVYNKTKTLTTLNGFSAPNFNNLHAFPDKFSLSFLQAETFTSGVDPEIPSPAPTPSPAAVDQNSLFTLVGSLNAAFSHHVSDPGGAWSGTAGVGFYHYEFLYMCPANSPYYNTANIPKGPNVVPNNPGTPAVALTDLDNSNALLTCAAMLNDLIQKYNWHRLAVNTHGLANDMSQIDKYKCSVGKIGDVGNTMTYVALSDALPTVYSDFGDVYSYVNNLKSAYNSHCNSVTATTIPAVVQFGLGNGGFHKQLDFVYPPQLSAISSVMSSNLCKLYDCTDVDSAELLIFWLRVLYGGLHYNDANSGTFLRTSMTTTAASAAVTALVRTDINVSIVGPAAWYLGTNLFLPATVAAATGANSTFGGPLVSLPTTTTGSGTATFQRQLSATGTGIIGQFSDSLYHASWNIGINDVNTSSVAQEQAGSLIATSLWSTGSDLDSWLELANEFFTCFASHVSGTGNNAAQSHLYNSASYVPSFANLIPSMTYQPFFMATVSQVSYAYIWTDQYTVETNGIEYLTQGNPTFADPQDVAVSYPVGYAIQSNFPAYYPSTIATRTRSNTISNLPTLVNDASTNYDVTNIQTNIYRTINDGTTWFLVDALVNGTTSYVDQTSDTLSVVGTVPLIDAEQLYTTGGVVGYDQAPQCKYIHIMNGTPYFGAITDDGQFFPNRIIQGIPFAPDSCNLTFFLDLPDSVTGISSVRGNVIAFCYNSISRVSGQFNTLGQGALVSESISDGTGCVSAKSIVRTEIGIFFAGTDGFYYTDGFQLIKISLELDKTYRNLIRAGVQQQTLTGCYDKINRRVWWNLMSNSQNGIDNDVTYIFYLNYGVKPSGVFTTANNYGLSGVNNWMPSSMVFWNGNNIRGDNRGYVFQAQDTVKTDPKVASGVAFANWNTSYIPYLWKSLAIELGTTASRKWLTKAHIIGQNSGNSAMTMTVIRDMNADGVGITTMAPFNYADNLTWGTPTCIWDDPVQAPLTVWDNTGKLDAWRRFPQTSLRADIVQLQLSATPAAAVYASSVNYPVGANCTVSALVASIITPTGYSDIIWPLDVVDMQIFFDTSGYASGYTVTAVNGNQITFLDPHGTSPTVASPGTQWMIMGYKKEQRPTVNSIDVAFAYFGDQTQGYSGKFSNSGPGNAGQNPN